MFFQYIELEEDDEKEKLASEIINELHVHAKVSLQTSQPKAITMTQK